MEDNILEDEFEEYSSYLYEKEDQEKYCGDDLDLEEE